MRPAQCLLGCLSRRDIDEGHRATYDRSLPLHWMRPVFDGKAGAVGTPNDFVVHVSPNAAPEGPKDPAFIQRVDGSISTAMVNEFVHVSSQQGASVRIAQCLQ